MIESIQRRPKKVIIIGASGHARVIADIVRCSGDEVIGFLDDRNPNELQDIKMLGRVDDAKTLQTNEVLFIVGIGNNDTREVIVQRLGALPLYTAVHPSAVIAADVKIGEGTVVMANAVINTGSYIGEHCIINTSATIDHDSVLVDYVHLSPGVHLSGTVYIGKGTWLGTGVVVSNNVSICGGCTIGAGAVVIRHITVAGTYIGIPVKMIGVVK